ncbi:unnamed protein product [Bathycoccus prasinos]|jgi:hypothetical protein|tara:strand:- start:673 stop:1269 length:597 start_codon:yes stop_codon:yes gene_type:complete
MGGTPSKHLADSGRKTVLKASAIVKSKGNGGGTTATTIQTPRKLPRNPSELESIITQPTREQWSAVMDPTTNTSNTTSLMHKKNPELVSNMHKIMNSSSGKIITESVINTVGKRREKMVNANGKMKPEEMYQLVRAVSSSKSSKKIEDEELNAIAKEHAHLVDKMDARIVKEYLAAPRLEKVMMRERQKLRTVGRWPE